MSAEPGGVVAEVLIEEGDPLNEGEVLLRLDGREQLQAAVAAAKLGLASAQRALD